MRMTAAFLLVKDNRTGLAFEAKPFFDPVNRLLENGSGHPRVLGRTQGQRKHVLAAFRAATHGLDFLERPAQIVRGKAAQLVQADMLIVVGAHQMDGQILAAAALTSFQDHGAASGFSPSAVMSR